MSQFLAIPVGLLLSGILVWQASTAAFVGVTGNSGNNATPANDISQYVDLTIEEGTGGTFANCAGFTPNGAATFTGTLATLTSTRTSYANGLGPWALDGTPPDTLSFRITWTFDAAAPPAAQNGSTPNVAFIWEAQS
ncbi:hypothetical protein [Nonomuraea lactucae]|uniref:hypothetical protein n=1 Tax=Nonomuraea lactucae TaxID=2249762 RepID=UPI0013B41C7E|nr:hypothetical protein [Nonomuraea lactucae]